MSFHSNVQLTKTPYPTLCLKMHNISSL